MDAKPRVIESGEEAMAVRSGMTFEALTERRTPTRLNFCDAQILQRAAETKFHHTQKYPAHVAMPLKA